MIYLKEKQHYIDLYDKLTIEHCRSIERLHLESDDKHFQENGKKFPKEEIARMKKSFVELHLYFETGEEYKRKEDTIQKWMDRDKERDERLENAEPPQLVRCKTCNSTMNFEDKHLWGSEDDKVLFFFKCPNNCLPHRLIYEDGSEWKVTPTLCPKCEHKVEKVSEEAKEHIVTTNYSCPNCSHTYTDTLDLTPKEEPEDPDFEKDRERFCLTEVKGLEYLEARKNMEEMGRMVEKWKEKEKHKDLYDKVAKLKKLSIPQLKNHIAELLKDEIYSSLVFEKPDMSRIVSLGFTVEDAVTENEYDSRQKLKKLLQKGLEDTNWRLMSEGISYRLGVLEGRLRGYEKEDDLVQLVSGGKKSL